MTLQRPILSGNTRPVFFISRSALQTVFLSTAFRQLLIAPPREMLTTALPPLSAPLAQNSPFGAQTRSLQTQLPLSSTSASSLLSLQFPLVFTVLCIAQAGHNLCFPLQDWGILSPCQKCCYGLPQPHVPAAGCLRLTSRSAAWGVFNAQG